MQTSVNEASLRAQAPRHLAGHGGEVLWIRVKEHPDYDGYGLILHRQEACVCSRHCAEPAPREPELISGDVESR
jgi:hypothetical protein